MKLYILKMEYLLLDEYAACFNTLYGQEEPNMGDTNLGE